MYTLAVLSKVPTTVPKILYYTVTRDTVAFWEMVLNCLTSIRSCQCGKLSEEKCGLIGLDNHFLL